jgi:Polysaccharide deacetylase.
MANNTGSFVISLDFELMWGVRDMVSKETYGQHINGVHTALPKLLKCFTKYKINATFAVVGLLFCKNKNDILKFAPLVLPGYTNQNLSPYGAYLHNIVGEDLEADPYHYGWRLVEKIRNTPGQEIGTHTFSHYYCLEEGQTVEEFKNDLEAAIAIAKKDGIEIKTIIFPRNQVNDPYLEECRNQGLSSYRGTEDSWFYEARNAGSEHLLRRLARLGDSYFNLSGHHCYTHEYMAESFPYNIPSSRFLRPYSKRFRFFEPLRLARIKKSMTHAARNKLTFHLWWHPHNFGINQDENFAFLEEILQHYLYLNKKYSFISQTMSGLAESLKKLKL